jgi:outer membrane lipoprotein carrier protein
MFNKTKGFAVILCLSAALLLCSCAANAPVKQNITDIKPVETVSSVKPAQIKKNDTGVAKAAVAAAIDTATQLPTATQEIVKPVETATEIATEEKAAKAPVEIKKAKGSKHKKSTRIEEKKTEAAADTKKTDAGNITVDGLIEKMNLAQADKVATSANVLIRTLYSKAEPQDVKGTAVLKKKDKFRIHYTSPQEQLLISDGKSIWVYTPAMQQAIKQSVESANVDAKLYTDMGSSIKHFARNSKTVLTEDDKAYNLVMVPEKGKGIPYDEITARIDKKSMYPVFMGMKYEGAATEMTFSDIVNYTEESAAKNTDLANKNFTFTAPEGVEVIEAEELMKGMTK